MSDDWRAKERAVDATLRELTPAIAEQLVVSTGQGWWAEVSEPHERFDRPGFLLHGPGEARLRVEKGNNHDVMTRVRILGLYPTKAHHYWYRDVTRDITVAVERGPEVIGKEIARRLLLGYLPSLEEAQRRIAENEADIARRLARRDTIRQITGGDLISHQQSESSSEVYLRSVLRSGSGGIRLYGDGSNGNLELSSVPYETLLAVAALLQRINSQLKVVA
jgi:hypothetical protein